MQNMKCAFLRGININGRNMKMTHVCQVFTDMGLENVSSILASGNIIFSSPKENSPLTHELEAALMEHYQYPVTLFIKDARELEQMLAAAPYEPNPQLHCYVFIGDPEVSCLLEDEFHRITPQPEEKAVVSRGIFYWQVPKGSTLNAGFSKILGRKDMKEKFTSRNLRTINKIYVKMKQIK